MTAMKVAVSTLVMTGLVLLVADGGTSVPWIPPDDRIADTQDTEPLTAWPVTAGDDKEIVDEYCVRCHSDRRLRGNLSLEGFDPDHPEADWATAEKMVVKLRAGMMPPPGVRRPAGDTLVQLVESLERRLDAAAARTPRPGGRTFQRLNRAEYAASVEELLGIEIDGAAFLPPDTKSDNFDNIADVQMLSPTLLDAYLNAAAEISRLAVGDPEATPSETTYTVSGYASQSERVEGAPVGTRGGISVVHNFPADGEYVFSVSFHHTTTGAGFAGQLARGQRLEVSIDGERVALMEVDSWLSYDDPWEIWMWTDPVTIQAGPHRVTAAFLKTSEGPPDDLLSPHDWSIADRHTGMAGYGLTLLPHLRDLVIEGPERVMGVSEHPLRKRIFTCRPTSPADEIPCARSILSELAEAAYRRPVTPRDMDGLMGFYRDGAAEGGFEMGIRTALQAILASPHFIFRFERPAAAADAGSESPAGPESRSRFLAVGAAGSDAPLVYPISDHALASRLSYFLWATPPDDELRRLADSGRLGQPAVLEEQVHRMLADPRSEALGTRFAAQWLRLQDLEKVHPDSYWFPDFHQQLGDAMRRETELFFTELVRRDGSVFDLYDADYTYLNERLAEHYGIEGVVGDDFRRVRYPDDRRRGLLGHGSIMTLTSHADRTSPELRGKWVMEVLMGTPPPPPPPGVPDLEETEAASEGRTLTTRERMEQHRANPTCNSCHRFIDPIGLALDGFDVTGRWRIREHGNPLDTRGELYDGTPIDSPAALVDALLRRPEPLLRTFTQNLMAYALGRRVEHYDQPTVREIVRQAASEDYRMSAFIRGVVTSDAFRMQQVDVTMPQDRTP
ncbi:MAG: DUF1592 domain-containing protein [Longimicrobiales bacterium]|nr:DUF1592 domain-containing protein [Longimicrobiales bacterium]